MFPKCSLHESQVIDTSWKPKIRLSMSYYHILVDNRASSRIAAETERPPGTHICPISQKFRCMVGAAVALPEKPSQLSLQTDPEDHSNHARLSVDLHSHHASSNPFYHSPSLVTAATTMVVPLLMTLAIALLRSASIALLIVTLIIATVLSRRWSTRKRTAVS